MSGNWIDGKRERRRSSEHKKRGKKHGSYKIYEDDKIYISYDTYYPNLQVYIKVGDDRKMVAKFSGHGHTVEYHKGKWEEYAMSLLQAALARKQQKALEAQKAKREREEKRWSSVDDSAVFAN